jgi:hypothetical protein
LHLANDWDFQIDLDGSFKWPIPNVVATDLRPDIVFVSNNMRIIIWGELTAPMERRISISAIKKKKRYIDLKARLMSKGWTVYDMTLEVGALGFTSTSVADFLTKLGFPQMQKKFMIKRMCVTALRSSFYIWNARHSLTWNPPILSNASATPFPKSDCWNDLATKPSAAKVFLAKISLNMSQKQPRPCDTMFVSQETKSSKFELKCEWTVPSREAQACNSCVPQVGFFCDLHKGVPCSEMIWAACPDSCEKVLCYKHFSECVCHPT